MAAIQPFMLDRIEKAETPRGTTGADWYRCVVRDSDQQITAYWRGERDQIDARADRFLAQLNGV